MRTTKLQIRSEKCCRIASALAQLGNATDADIAEALGVDLSTLHSWKVTYPEFAEALKASPGFSDAAVARSLLKCALGYSYATEKFIYTREGGAVRNDQIDIILPTSRHGVLAPSAYATARPAAAETYQESDTRNG